MINDGLRILVRKEDDVFVAQCVEYDICTQANDMPTLQARMDVLIETELRAAASKGMTLPPAPDGFEAIWDNGGTSPHNYRVEAA